MEPEFVGNGRKALVEGLVQLFDATNAGGGPVWVALEAPSGWGKTRVIHEFYRQLAEKHQEEPKYWPMSILSDTPYGNETCNDVEQRRKRVNPKTHKHVPGSLPRFMWWGVSCFTRAGTGSEALTQDLGTFAAHVGYLSDRWREVTSRAERVKTSGREMLNQGIRPVGEIGVQSLVEVGVGVVIPGTLLDIGRLLAKYGVDVANRRTEHKERVKSTDEIIIPTTSIVDDTVEQLLRLARPGIPLILFVEDVHLADPSLCDLLGRLVRSESAIMIITTALRGPALKNEALYTATSFAEDCDRLFNVGIGDKYLRKPFGKAASLKKLNPMELAPIIAQTFSEADVDTLERVAVRYDNPLAIELFCQLKRFSTQAPKLEVSNDELESLNTSVESLYGQLFAELPDDLQEGLCAATLGIPTVIDPDNGNSNHWDMELVIDALNSRDTTKQTGACAALETSSETYDWTRKIAETTLHGFNEAAQLRAARDNNSFFSEDDCANLTNLIVSQLMRQYEIELEGVKPWKQVHNARAALALHAGGLLANQDILNVAKLVMLRHLMPHPRELAEQRRILDVSTSDSTGMAGLNLELQRHEARVLAESGRVSEAVKVTSDLLKKQIRELGNTHPGTLITRSTLAGYTVEVGQLDKGIKMFKLLCREQERVLGSDHPDTLATRSGLITAIGETGRVIEAIEMSEALLADIERVSGNEDPEFFRFRSALAHWVGKSGRVEKSIEMLTKVLHDQERTLGGEHSDTLTTRGSLAAATIELGLVDVATGMLNTLLNDQKRMLGDDHPKTLTTRTNIATLVGKSGRIDDAISMLKALYDDQVRVRGKDHPEALAARSNLLAFMGELSPTDEVIGMFKELCADQVRVLGEDHVATLATQGNLAMLIGNTSSVDEAIAMHEDLLANQLRIVGKNHPSRLAMLSNLIYWIGISGQTDRALEMASKLLDDQMAVLNDSHPDVFTTRGNLAGFTWDSGRKMEAINMITLLLTDQIAALGEDHPAVIETQNLLATLTETLVSLSRAVQSLALAPYNQIQVIDGNQAGTYPTKMVLSRQWGTQPIVKSELEKTPRSRPCPCGSGKKFKRCCGEVGAETYPSRLM